MTTPAKNPLKPLYAIISEQSFLRDQAVARLRDRISQEGDLDFNYEQFDMATAKAEDIIGASNTLPFASPYRLVMVINFDQVKKADLDEITAYAQSPSESTVLALVGSKLAKSSKLYKLINTLGGIVERKAPSKRELPGAVEALFAEKNKTVEYDAIHALINSVGEDLATLASDVAKVASYVGERTSVTAQDIVAVVAVSAEVKVWEFANALAERNGSKALDLLGRTLEQGSSIFAAQSMALRTVRELLLVRALIDRGEGQSARVASELGKQEWLARKTLDQARNFSATELRGALRRMAHVEDQMKSTGFAQLAFERWIVELCA